MTYEEKRMELIGHAEKLLTIVGNDFTQSRYTQSVENLLDDLQADGQMVTVLGEFKRGKSSLINALLGVEILPANIIPTTATINVVQHDLDEKVLIHYQDGDVVSKALSAHVLEDFTYDEGEDLMAIHHIDIHMPLTQFSEQTVLIDTPGVGDLNEHRIDVTYSYIPRSNLIVFVFDATAPIRKTELDYLRDTVLKLRFGEVVFVANFIDRLDEDELEETLEYMEGRLNRVMGDLPYKLFALSSLDALEEPEIDEFQEFVTYLREQINHGAASEKKLKFYTARLEDLYELIEGEMQVIAQLKEVSEVQLEEAEKELLLFKSDSEKHLNTLKAYTANRKEEILQIIGKSIAYFAQELEAMIADELILFEGGNFKRFVERRIPIIVNREVKNWMTAYAAQIDLLIGKLEQEIIRGFSNLFEKDLGSLNNYNAAFQLDKMHFTTNLDVKSSKVNFYSGSIAAGASIIATVATGGLLLPAITLLGYPALKEKLASEELEKQKKKLTPLILGEIGQAVDKLNQIVEKYVVERIEDLENLAIERFNSHIKTQAYHLKLELDLRKEEIEAEQPKLPIEQLQAFRGIEV